jgi:hypothetical protein
LTMEAGPRRLDIWPEKQRSVRALSGP